MANPNSATTKFLIKDASGNPIPSLPAGTVSFDSTNTAEATIAAPNGSTDGSGYTGDVTVSAVPGAANGTTNVRAKRASDNLVLGQCAVTVNAPVAGNDLDTLASNLAAVGGTLVSVVAARFNITTSGGVATAAGDGRAAPPAGAISYAAIAGAEPSFDNTAKLFTFNNQQMNGSANLTARTMYMVLRSYDTIGGAMSLANFGDGYGIWLSTTTPSAYNVRTGSVATTGGTASGAAPNLYLVLVSIDEVTPAIMARIADRALVTAAAASVVNNGTPEIGIQYGVGRGNFSCVEWGFIGEKLTDAIYGVLKTHAVAQYGITLDS